MEPLMDGLGEEAQDTLQRARDAAVAAGHSYVGTEHLLAGLAADGTSTAALLQALGGDPERLRGFASQRMRPNPKREGGPVPTDDLTAAVAAGRDHAARLGHDSVRSEHLLLGLADGLGRGYLRAAGLDVDRVWDTAQEMLGVPGEERIERPSKQEEGKPPIMFPELRVLRRVVPIAQTRTAPDGGLSVTFFSIEDYADGFLLRGTFVVRDVPKEEGWPPRVSYFPTLLMQIVDDRGTPYEQRRPGGGGGMGRYHVELGFTPALSAAAEHLQLTLTELRWDRHDHDTGLHDLHRRDPLGWTFTIPLAGREHIQH